MPEESLPLKGFKWSGIDIDILNIPKDSRIGYILKVDLEYPRELHNAHNQYPLAPEHVTVENDMLSPFQKEHFPSLQGNVTKLIPNLQDKTKCCPLS